MADSSGEKRPKARQAGSSGQRRVPGAHTGALEASAGDECEARAPPSVPRASRAPESPPHRPPRSRPCSRASRAPQGVSLTRAGSCALSTTHAMLLGTPTVVKENVTPWSPLPLCSIGSLHRRIASSCGSLSASSASLCCSLCSSFSPGSRNWRTTRISPSIPAKRTCSHSASSRSRTLRTTGMTRLQVCRARARFTSCATCGD